MAKLNKKVVRIGTVKKELKKLSRDQVKEIDIGFAMFRCHRKTVAIRGEYGNLMFLSLTWKEFREICYTLDFLNGEKLKYLI